MFDDDDPAPSADGRDRAHRPADPFDDTDDLDLQPSDIDWPADELEYEAGEWLADAGSGRLAGGGAASDLPEVDEYEERSRRLHNEPPRRRVTGSGTSMLAAAMLGLRDVLYGKPKEETVIEVESSGDPPNIDLDGLDEAVGDTHRMVGPPLDQIKARAARRRRRRRPPGDLGRDR